MEIRCASIDDFDNIKEILSDSFAFKCSKKMFDKYIEKHNILLVNENQEDIGCAIYEIHYDIFADRKILFLRYLCVKQKFQNLGIGKILIEKIKKIAVELKVNAIELTCADFREKSHGFYLANNFSIKKTKVFICDDFKYIGGG